jgi:hypothetical protein
MSPLKLDKINNVLKKIRKRNEEGKKEFRNLYSLLENPNLAKWATGKILRNKGIYTPGVDKEGVDGLNLERIERICKKLKDGKYDCHVYFRSFCGAA